MSHAKTSLIVLVAFSLPSAAKALGLGEIHLDSALNERLAAEVEIVGATAEDLEGITASVAKGETFLRFGVDRPAFLSSATFRIAMDDKGQPVLAIRSTEAFTEPLINLLIDLRWRSGELIRQYTLLLDPPQFLSDVAVAKALPPASRTGGRPAPAPAVVGEVSPPVSSMAPSHARSPVVAGPISPEIVRVAAGATLRGIASRISARGDVGLQRLMIAIFHANPNAFAGNINRLRSGAELSVPSIPEVSKISEADANQEFRLQMDTWHASAKFSGPAKAVEQPIAAPAPTPDEAAIRTEPPAAQSAPAAARQESISKSPDGASGAPGNSVAAPEDAELDRRVQVLENGLNELQDALHREQGTLAGIQAKVARADKAPAATVALPPAKSGRAISIAGVLVLASVAFGILFAWRRRRMIELAVLPADAKAQEPKVPRTAAPAPTPAAALARSEPPRAAPVKARQPAPVDARSPAPVETRSPVPVEARRPASVDARSPAKEELRQTAVDASGQQRAILAAAFLDDIDIESVNASQFSGTGGAFEHEVEVNVDSAGTADLGSTTIKTRVDANAQTTPLEAVRTWDMPEVSIPEAVPEVDTARLQYKLLDLDGTVHYVPMPSILHEKGGLKERRTSLVDVLKVAVKREPNRRDLRMKLLETYHAAAATSRQGFLEVAQSLASERESMSDGEWGKIVGMGRQIAADDDLFASDSASADDKLASYG